MANNYKHMVSFSGKTIEVTVTDKGSMADEWVQNVLSLHSGNEKMIVGLDCEWRPHVIRSMSNKTATLQLCIDTKCLILQMFYIDYIPQSIKNFLNDPNITFVGVEVGDDAVKLREEYGLRVASTSDIQAVAMTRWPIRFYRKPGLKRLAYAVAGISMEKPMHVCRSNWEARVLDEKQVEYGCIDAYACYRIGLSLVA